MKEFYTLQEVTGLLGQIAPKTLREWMAVEGMKALKDKSDPRRKLLSHSQVEVLAAGHGRILPVEPSPSATDPLVAMEARIASLEREVKTLKQRLQEREASKNTPLARQDAPQPAIPIQPTPTTIRPVPKPSSPPAPRDEAPLSVVGARIFLTQHAVPERDSRSWYDLPIGSRRVVLLYAQQHAAPTPCTDVNCPCHEVLG